MTNNTVSTKRRGILTLVSDEQLTQLYTTGNPIYRTEYQEKEVKVLFFWKKIIQEPKKVLEGHVPMPEELIKMLSKIESDTIQETREIYHGHCHGCITNTLNKNICKKCFCYDPKDDPDTESYENSNWNNGIDNYRDLEDLTNLEMQEIKINIIPIAKKKFSSYFI